MDLNQLLAMHKNQDPDTRIKPWVPS
jgi:hypothetical protein